MCAAKKTNCKPLFYQAKYECSNCEWKGDLNIPKGTLKEKNMECPACGCKTANPQVKVAPIIPAPKTPVIPKPIPSPWDEFDNPWKKEPIKPWKPYRMDDYPDPWRKEIWYNGLVSRI